MKYSITGTGIDLEAEVLDAPAGRYRVRIQGAEYDVGWNPALGRTHWWLEREGRRQLVAVEPEGDAVGVTLAIDHLEVRIRPASPLSRKRRERGGGPRTAEVRAPMPGLLVTVEVTPGQAVDAGATVAVIEAMKMQMELRASVAGTVREVRVAAGQEVAAGEVIALLVPDGGGQ